MSDNTITVSFDKISLTTNEIAERTGKRHDNVLSDSKKMLVELYGERGLLKFQETYIQPQNKQEYPCYRLPKKDVLVLVAGYSIKLRKAIIDRLEELEKNQMFAGLPDFTNPIIAARAWADEVEKKQIAEQQLIEQRPKVIFADAVETSKTTILVGEMAKILKQNGVKDMGQNRFFSYLREHGFLIKRSGTDKNMPTQKSMEMGLFEIKERSLVNPDGSVRITKTPKITGKGQTYFVNRLIGDSEDMAVEAVN